MKQLTRTRKTVLASAVVGLALAGCGSSGSTASTASTLSGVAAAEAPLGGARLTLKDSSTTQQQKTAASSDDGTFSFDVTGLQPPFLLQAEYTDGDGDHKLRSVADQPGSTHVDQLTESALAAAATARQGDSGDDDDREGHERTASRAGAFLRQLRTALAPLFDLYGLGADLLRPDPKALRTLLADVKFSTDDGTLVVTNRATGAVIFSGSVGNLAAGTFHPENMPAGPGTTPSPPPGACAYSYSAWGACQSDGTQTRTVASSSPTGCTGTPVLSQPCTSTPPALDGAALYAAKCASCHGPLATSAKRGRTAAQITAANMTQGLSAAEVQAVAAALAGTTPPPPTACTYTTGAWGACQSNGTQTRTVTASPSGCTGTPPASSQSCTYVPPVVTCTGFTYNGWAPATCPSSGQQTRTVAISTPTGCTGGSPVLTQSCTYVPPVTTCSSFTYSAWGTCSASGTQTRTVTSSAPTGCTGGSPVLSQSCTPPPLACTYTYGAWGACQSNGTQTRTVASSSPSGCTGTPVLSQACTYTPPIDGAALYTQYCSGCHGNGKKGQSASKIQSAINSNTGGMGSLSSLTSAQIAAISAAP